MKLPYGYHQEVLKTPFSAQMMQQMNAKVEAIQMLLHEIDKKQLTCQAMCEFQKLPVAIN